MNHVIKQGLLFNLSVALSMLGGSPLLIVFLFPETKMLLVLGIATHWVLLIAGILVFIYMTYLHKQYIDNLWKNNDHTSNE